MILNLDILIYNLFASLELRLMCSLLTFQVSRINLEQFYETYVQRWDFHVRVQN